ncbi:putative MFS-type transporter YhjX [Vibrio aerogenes CECT 7868]|uniref:Putative MFS-type transporter YhjX n=1 Tax=Vibrio aerogenes CECT 7868 TaxID=1216006 RepID=A0A1M5UM83_9VIBR|nr:OFA family MFS transporter [Vibrio aerogenes]SHH64061.1 putative MFS-type transporter YhjX [Vibrio aerogenes CECT 7868]
MKHTNYSRRRWLILTAGCFINLCIGSMYAWSVFSAPMADYLSQLNGTQLTAADLAIVFVVANSVGPVTMISGGRINDMFGPKLVILVGGLMFGGGMVFSGFATSITHLIVGYGLLTGLGLGMVYGATISTSIKFFPDKRGLVGGLSTALFGISSVIIPPVAAAITRHMGILSSFKIIGIAFTVIVCVSGFFIDKCPDGFKPDGWRPPQKSGDTHQENFTWKQMLGTPTFYILLVLLTCGAVAGLMCIALAAPLARQMIGMSVASATAAVSTLALLNVSGRVAAGVLSDKIGRVNTLALACVLSVAGLYLLYIAGQGDVKTFYAGISVIGVCFGAFMGVFPGLTADQFGTKHNSVNFGIMFCGFAIAGYVGPTIMRQVFDATGSFKGAFLIGIGFCLAGFVLTGIYHLLHQKARRMKVAAEH